VAAVVLLALNFHQYFRMGWSTLTYVSMVLIPLLVIACGFFSRRQACRRIEESQEEPQKEGETS
jgi:hypothetical protein